MCEILYGKPVADDISALIFESVNELKMRNIMPTLAIIRIGDDDGAEIYSRSLARASDKYGIKFVAKSFDDNTRQENVIKTISLLNQDDDVHGILLLRPVPNGFNAEDICQSIKADKDVDCVTFESVGRLHSNSRACFPPATAEACIRLLDYYGINVEGKNAVIIGRSVSVGKPLSALLLSRNATVTVCHSHTKDLRAMTRDADIVFTAIGSSKFFDRSFFSKDSIIIDIGINDDGEGGICGDVDYSDVMPISSAITPVPRGIGSITVPVMMLHVVDAAKRLEK